MMVCFSEACISSIPSRLDGVVSRLEGSTDYRRERLKVINFNTLPTNQIKTYTLSTMSTIYAYTATTEYADDKFTRIECIHLFAMTRKGIL